MTLRRSFLTLLGLGLAILLAANPTGGVNLLSVQAAAAQETVTVQGVAVNGTAGGEAPANLPVTLHSIDPVAGRVAAVEATTDDSGGFRFDEVALLDRARYVLVMDYAGMRYNSLLEPEALPEPVEFTVYETTKDISVIEVERQAMIIADVNEKDREIAVLEFLSVNNASERTLLPELTNITNPNEISFLRFSLPTGASELDVQSDLPGGDIITIGAGFAITAPVLPGRHRVSYTYKFPYQGEQATFNQRLIQGAAVYQVLAPEPLAEIQVAPLEAKPRIDVEGTTYLLWESRDIPPRRGVTLELSQLPQPSLLTRVGRTVTDGNLWQTAIPVMLGVALAAVLLYAWFRGPRTERIGPADLGDAATPAGQSQVRRQALVQSVAALDSRFEQGRISEDEYRPRREELMAQLRQVANPTGDARDRTP